MVRFFGFAALCTAASLAVYEPFNLGAFADEIRSIDSSSGLMNLAQRKTSGQKSALRTLA